MAFRSRDDTMRPEVLFRKVDEARARKSRLEFQWKEALAFYHNEHYAEWTSSSRQFVTTARKTGQPSRLTLNFYQGIAATMAAMLTKSKPIPTAVPMADGFDEEMRARGTDALIQHIWQLADVHTSVEQLVLTACVLGSSFWKVWWDDHDGPLVPTPDPENPGAVILAPSGAPVFDVLLPFHVAWNDTVEFRRSPWCLQVSVLTPEDVWDRWDKDVKPDTNPEDMANGGVIRFDTRSSEKMLGVAVAEYWHRPCSEYPKGMHYTSTRKDELDTDEWGPGNPWPIHHYKLYPGIGTTWGLTPMSSFIPINKAIDKIETERLAHIAAATRQGFLYKKGQFPKLPEAGAGKNAEWEGQPADTAPVPLSVQKLEAWVQTMSKDYLGFGQLLTGVSDVVQGQAAFSRMSGRVGERLAEFTNTKFAGSAERLSVVLCDGTLSAVELWRQFGPPEETLRVMGLDGQAAYRPVKTQEIGKGISYRTLKLEVSSILSKSQAALQEQLFQWLQAGVLDPDQFKKLAPKAGIFLDEADPEALDRAWARCNLDTLRTEVLPDPTVLLKPWMGWGTHFEYMAAYMKTPSFRNDPPAIRQQLERYLTAIQPYAAPPGQGAPMGPSGAPSKVGPQTQPDTPGPKPSPGVEGVAAPANGYAGPPGVNVAEEQASMGA